MRLKDNASGLAETAKHNLENLLTFIFHCTMTILQFLTSHKKHMTTAMMTVPTLAPAAATTPTPIRMQLATFAALWPHCRTMTSMPSAGHLHQNGITLPESDVIKFLSCFSVLSRNGSG